MKYSYKFIFQGIEKDEAAPSQDCLTEFLNDTVIIRSLRCKFTLKDENCDNSDLKSACDECAKILTSHSMIRPIKKEIKTNSDQSLPQHEMVHHTQFFGGLFGTSEKWK